MTEQDLRRKFQGKPGQTMDVLVFVHSMRDPVPENLLKCIQEALGMLTFNIYNI